MERRNYAPTLYEKRYKELGIQSGFLVVLAAMATAFIAQMMQIGVLKADNFTDVFYTNSFRGSFEWFKKLDVIGMVVQAVISIFSLVGVCLIVIRVMTSLLFLSARGLWEEVHELKQAGGESEMYDFGVIGMAKNWAKGKAGTGLDALFGAILVLLPDVKRYSDFGERSGQSFDEDITISQYMLKIALPTVLAVFFLAMGFNGTLVKGLAVTVDAMGTIADKAVSVNYAGFVEDIINSGSGYRFTYAASGTEQGKLQEKLAKDLYGRAIAAARGADQSQLYQIGINVENALRDFPSWCANSPQVSTKVKDGLRSNAADRYYGYLGFEVISNTSSTKSSGEVTSPISLSSLMEGTGLVADQGFERYFHIYIKQTNSFDGSYFNVDELK